eukprot:m.149461 g.149461  ORF g.149461 m.149461 type:complete len:284 (-) comp16858_c1_seq1:194-1045(-)
MWLCVNVVVCMCMCVCALVCVSVFECLFACPCLSVHLCVRVSVYVRVYAYTRQWSSEVHLLITVKIPWTLTLVWLPRCCSLYEYTIGQKEQQTITAALERNKSNPQSRLSGVPAPETAASTPQLASPTSGSEHAYDMFLTHNWGEDERGRSNHERVKRINAVLKQRGIRTWFDEDRMKGNVVKMMFDGIDNSKTVVVFVTQTYRDKVNNVDSGDNCASEFGYAHTHKGPGGMVAVVMEERMVDKKQWKGPLGTIAGRMWVPCFEDDEATINKCVDALLSELGK